MKYTGRYRRPEFHAHYSGESTLQQTVVLVLVLVQTEGSTAAIVLVVASWEGTGWYSLGPWK